MKKFLKKSLKTRNLLLVTAFLIASVLFLHAAIPHDHPGEIFGNGIQAALHGSDKKWWLLILLTSLLLAFGNSIKNRVVGERQITSPTSFWLTFDFSKIFDPLREALRRGILQPILYE